MHREILLFQAPVLLFWVLSRRARSRGRFDNLRRRLDFWQAHDLQMSLIKAGLPRGPELTHDTAHEWLDLRTRPKEIDSLLSPSGV